MKYLIREELNKQCMIHIDLMSDLIRDVENIIKYLTYSTGSNALQIDANR